MSILQVTNLCKKIGKKEILKNVSFAIEKGDILAFIGANGAGKTTTIKCILGLQKMDSGTITINGYDIKKDFVKAISSVGAIVESPDVYQYLTGMENLEMQASFYKDTNFEDIMRVVRLVGLENRIYDKVSKYSLGMKQRLGIAISLINNPDLLILDEPTNGLDPEGIKELRELLLKLAKNGTGILISSHNLSELESFCNKVCIIQKGKIITENSITELKTTSENKYHLKVDNASHARKVLGKKATLLDDYNLELFADEEGIAQSINLLVEHHVKIYEVIKESLSLEEAFITIAGGEKIV